jgi:hypothetical protein
MKVAGIFFWARAGARGELAAANQNRSRKHVEFGEGIPEPHFSRNSINSGRCSERDSGNAWPQRHALRGTVL